MNKPPLKQRLLAGETCTGTSPLFLSAVQQAYEPPAHSQPGTDPPP